MLHHFKRWNTTERILCKKTHCLLQPSRPVLHILNIFFAQIFDFIFLIVNCCCFAVCWVVHYKPYLLISCQSRWFREALLHCFLFAVLLLRCPLSFCCFFLPGDFRIFPLWLVVWNFMVNMPVYGFLYALCWTLSGHCMVPLLCLNSWKLLHIVSLIILSPLFFLYSL